MSLLRRAMRRRERGQGMTEYIIIIAVVAVLSLVVITKFGSQIRNLFVTSGDQLAGSDDVTQLDEQMDEDDIDQGLSDLDQAQD